MKYRNELNVNIKILLKERMLSEKLLELLTGITGNIVNIVEGQQVALRSHFSYQ